MPTKQSRGWVGLSWVEGVGVVCRLAPQHQCLSLHLDCVSVRRSSSRAYRCPGPGSTSRLCPRVREAALPTFRRAKPQSAHSLAFRKRTGFSYCTLCFRFPFARETPRRVRPHRKNPRPRPRLNRTFQLYSNSSVPTDGKTKNRTAVRGVSDHRRTARTRVRWTVQAGSAFCRSARSLSLQPSLADARPPRALRARG